MPGTGGKSKQSAYMQRCVADVVASGKDTQAAFAICKAGGNKAGYYQPGSMKLTGKGKKRSGQLAKEPDMPAKERAYTALLKRAHEALGERVDVEQAGGKRPPREWNQREFDRIAAKLAEMATFTELRRAQSQLFRDQTRNYREAERTGALKDTEGELAQHAADMVVIERLYAAAIGRLRGTQPTMESTSHLLARMEARPAAIEHLMLEGWNCEAVSGVSVADAIEDLIADYAEDGEVSLRAIGKELLDIGRNNPDSIRQAVEALKKAGIKVVRR